MKISKTWQKPSLTNWNRLEYPEKNWKPIMTNCTEPDLINPVSINNHWPLNSKASFKEKIYNKQKHVNKNIKLVPSLTRDHSQLLNKLQIALNNSRKNGIFDAVKFVFADVHGSLKIVLLNPYKNRCFFFRLWTRVPPVGG